MDNQNPQMPNPMPSQPTGPMPSMPAAAAKKKGMWLWLIVAIALVVAGTAWWYISQMVVETVIQQQPIDQEAREDTLLNADIQAANLGDLDKEFQAVDNDLNSL